MPNAMDTSDLYIPSQRYKTVRYQDADEEMPPFWAKVRTSLTAAEFESLNTEESTPVEEAWVLYAPFVVAWNAAAIDKDGNAFKVQPPAVGGPEMFDYIPRPLFIRIANDIRLLIVSKVDPKSSISPVNTGSQ